MPKVLIFIELLQQNQNSALFISRAEIEDFLAPVAYLLFAHKVYASYFAPAAPNMRPLEQPPHLHRRRRVGPERNQELITLTPPKLQPPASGQTKCIFFRSIFFAGIFSPTVCFVFWNSILEFVFRLENSIELRAR